MIGTMLWPVACSWALTCAGATSAGERLVVCTYPVGDLVLPAGGKGETLEDRLVELITHVVARKTRLGFGGRGTVQYFPLGLALVVEQSAQGHRRLAALLTSLRASRVPWYQLQ
jgi:hypothetical protein